VKVFVDANVLVSAAATRGLCADVLREILASHELVVSPQVLDEVKRVLRAKFGADPELVAEYVGFLEQDAVISLPGKLPDVVLRDKDDLPVLAAAISSRARLLVSGDNELLDMAEVEEVKIVSPRRFWEKLRSRRPH
jgi:uncharacterized protein